MTPLKIKWRAVKEGKHAYVITSEVSLGSARYTEFFCVSRQEVEYGQHTGDSSTLWKIIEKMQWNILDALGYYDFDPPVSYDFERIQASVNSGTIVVPSGLSRLERREWIRKNKGDMT